MNKMLMILALCIITAFPVHANRKVPSPLGLPWAQKVPDTFRNIPGWRYFYGDSSWGMMVFYGDAFNMESELQLRFANRKISNATLILGPKGLDDYGCLSAYKRVVKLLTTKYGNPAKIQVTESEMKEDLVYSTICSPVRAGLYVHETMWNVGSFYIVAAVYGDDVDIFIEVDYIFKPLESEQKKAEDAKLLKFL